LKKEIAENRFREDLYHRIAVMVIKVPSLNNRAEDIPELVEKFLNDVSTENGWKKKDIDQKAMKALTAYNWTGNIRELRNVVERLAIMSDSIISQKEVEKYL
jgi:DNA-binding NtrC family response regulator